MSTDLPTLEEFIPSRVPEPYTYHEIPTLQLLIKDTAGRAGVTYLQVALPQLKKAEEQGFHELQGSHSYTIVGPKGQVDCRILGFGKPIPGVSSQSGARRCIVDNQILEQTGLELPEYLEVVYIVRPTPKPEPEPRPPLAKPNGRKETPDGQVAQQ